MAPPTALPALLRVLGEPVRLRILALVERDELSVGELSRALGMAQSRVGNHLRVLREAGLVTERHAGTRTLLRSALRPGSSNGLPDYARDLWDALRAGLEALPEREADRVRLEDVLRGRRRDTRDFFDRVAGQWDALGARFATGQARQRAVAQLLPRGMVLADLGCGTGYLSRALVPLAGRLICIDGSSRMLDEARRRLEPLPEGVEVELRQGELDDLPLDDGELDGALAGMVLHHLPDLEQPLAEMHRCVRPGGTAVVLELLPHKETWMQDVLGDHHLGLEPSEVAAALRRAGFVDVRLESIDDRYLPQDADAAAEPGSEPIALPLYLVRGHVPRSSP